jgi:uncharacterized protein (DUF4415 family)
MSKGAKKTVEKIQREIAALERLPEDRVDTRDIPELIDWSRAMRGRFYKPVKKPISIRLDADVLAWFQARGGRYQRLINEALREYMEQHSKQEDRA